MKPYFLFPCSPLDPRAIDDTFTDQANALQKEGFAVAVWQPETNRIRFSPLAPISGEQAVVYRGWMLKLDEYDRMAQAVAAHDAKLLTDRDAYYSTHYLPNWYFALMDVTPQSIVFPNEHLNLGELPDFVRQIMSGPDAWGKVVIKDYVKSLKTAGGSIIDFPDRLKFVIDTMIQYRGEIEGGIVLRKFENFIPGTEKRFFCLNGRAYTAHLDNNIRVMAETTYLPLAADVAERAVQGRIASKFFSIDIALLEGFEPRVIEIGDGQVSDLVGWTPEEFAGMWVGQ